MLPRTGELRDALEQHALPGAAELGEVLEEIVGGPAATHLLDLRKLKQNVYRLRAEARGQVRSLVLKCSNPGLARRNLLVARHWLPAMGLGDACARVLGSAADRRGERMWLIYEDLGDSALHATQSDRARVSVAVDLISQLHLRSAPHPILPECRSSSRDLGAGYFAANVGDAIHSLELLCPPRIALSPEPLAVRDRLLARLHGLRDERPRRAQTISELGGRDVLLHGDLWTTNVCVIPGEDGLRARLVDWDQVGVGPASYDLSTFLYRFPPGERSWILDRYRRAVAPAGWRLPDPPELNLLFETAEYARYANRVIWPAVALLEEGVQGAAWGLWELEEVERWFEAYQPCLR